jgi:hypothetical protein
MFAQGLALTAGSDPAAELRARFTRLLARAAPEAFKAYGFVECRPAEWNFAGVTVEAGDRATAMAALFAGGLPVRIPSARLCMRVEPDGATIDARGGTHSIVAARAGRVEVSIQVPVSGEHAPGRLPCAEEKDFARPVAFIVTVVWRTSALRGLRYLASAGDVDGLVRDEIHRLCNPAAGRTGSEKTVESPSGNDRTASTGVRMPYRW